MAVAVDKARRAAVAALVRVHRGGWANLAAAGAFAAPGLNARDRAFAGAVFYGSAERLVTLDWLLAPWLKKPVDKLDVEVRAILECGLYQMLYMNVPQRAAVDESVKLARSFGKSSAAGLVNAVLRRAGAAGQAPRFEDADFAGESERVQVVHSVGPAVARAVMEALPGEYDAFFEASRGKSELCLRANTLKTAAGQLAEQLEESGAAVRPGQVPNALYASLPGGVAGEALFEAGLYHVQGEASQYACACLDARPGMRVLDLCAAPGGKSATLAQQMYDGTSMPGTGLTSCDVRENRLPLISQVFERLGIGAARVLLNDAAVYDEGLCAQHRVLCDVPCSGLGVLAGKADLRYTDGGGFEALPALQYEILCTAARYVRDGGRLVYSTCTVRPQENEEVVRRFLAQAKGYRIVPAPALPGAVVREEMVTILPQHTGLDGFFVAVLQKV